MLLTEAKSGETNNNILGYLFNPLNTKLTAGGSSGGEEAVAAFKGSAFGVGAGSGRHSTKYFLCSVADSELVGGSVSMLAAYNGAFNLKPSSGRLSFNGIPTNVSI